MSLSTQLGVNVSKENDCCMLLQFPISHELLTAQVHGHQDLPQLRAVAGQLQVGLSAFSEALVSVLPSPCCAGEVVGAHVAATALDSPLQAMQAVLCTPACLFLIKSRFIRAQANKICRHTCVYAHLSSFYTFKQFLCT